MLHLNDSKSELGSRLDRHEHLGAGRIGVAGLRHLLCHPALAHATYYLETPGMDEGYDAVNVARAYDIAAGRPLADLPPEAHGGAAAAGRGRRRHDGATAGRPAPTRRRRRRPRRRPPPRRPPSGCSWSSSRSCCSSSPPCCACPTSRRAGRGTRTRATTCSCSGRSSATGRAAARPADLDRRRPPRGALLLRAGAGGCLTGGDSPLAVVSLIALAGIAAVRRHVVAGAVDRGARRRRRGRARDGGLGRRHRGIDVHLEPEPDRPVQRGRARGRVAGVVDPPSALVAARRASGRP